MNTSEVKASVSNSLGYACLKKMLMKADERRVDRSWHETVGAAIREAREKRNVSQGALATRVGVDIATVSKTERGETSPSFVTIVAIADALDLSLDELIGRRSPLDLLPAGSFRFDLPRCHVYVTLRVVQKQAASEFTRTQADELRLGVGQALSHQLGDLHRPAEYTWSEHGIPIGDATPPALADRLRDLGDEVRRLATISNRIGTFDNVIAILLTDEGLPKTLRDRLRRLIEPPQADQS